MQTPMFKSLALTYPAWAYALAKARSLRLAGYKQAATCWLAIAFVRGRAHLG